MTGIHNNRGLMDILTHRAAIIGIKTDAVEVFEQTPVIKEIIRAAKNGKNRGEIPSIKLPIVSPNSLERP